MQTYTGMCVALLGYFVRPHETLFSQMKLCSLYIFLVSDIAIFVLKRDVKLQRTNLYIFHPSVCDSYLLRAFSLHEGINYTGMECSMPSPLEQAPRHIYPREAICQITRKQSCMASARFPAAQCFPLF